MKTPFWNKNLQYICYVWFFMITSLKFFSIPKLLCMNFWWEISWMLLTDFMPSFDPFKPFIETIGNLRNLFYVNMLCGKNSLRKYLDRPIFWSNFSHETKINFKTAYVLFFDAKLEYTYAFVCKSFRILLWNHSIAWDIKFSLM